MPAAQNAAYRGIFCSSTYFLSPNGTHVPHCSDCNKIDSYCGGSMFAGVHEKWAVLLWILGRIAFWFGVAGVLHRRGWYWAL